MDRIHILSLQLLELVEAYEHGIKNEMSFADAKELRKKIVHLQSELESQRSFIKVE